MKSRLRHPIRSIREPFGKAGLTVAILALVMAMVGGAFAANHSATASKAGKQGKQGKQGKPGKTGPAGPAGPAGAPGAKGDTGAAGSNGAPGTSVTTESFATSKTVGSVTCTEGGVAVKSASPETAVCKGAKGNTGPQGPEGEPWTPNNTLPSGATEKGVFAISGQPVETVGGLELAFNSISFPIPLSASVPAKVISPAESPPSGCSGTAAAPKADPGHLCVFVANPVNVGAVAVIHPDKSEVTFDETAQPTGTVIAATSSTEPATPLYVYGTWAVAAAE